MKREVNLDTTMPDHHRHAPIILAWLFIYMMKKRGKFLYLHFSHLGRHVARMIGFVKSSLLECGKPSFKVEPETEHAKLLSYFSLDHPPIFVLKCESTFDSDSIELHSECHHRHMALESIRDKYNDEDSSAPSTDDDDNTDTEDGF
jgi:hypothetical protein